MLELAEQKLRESVADFLYLEAETLDERRWDDWLQLYAEDCEYWVPSWDSEHELVSDPNNDISLIYYNSRIGLEDRVYRLNTDQSSASTPLPRTCRLISNIRPRLAAGHNCEVKYNWVTHYFRMKEAHLFFGSTECVLVASAKSWLVAKKKITVMNDLIPNVLDIYHLG